jgi:hypothetical protein
LAALLMDGPVGLNPFRQPPEGRARRLRYPVIEAT